MRSQPRATVGGVEKRIRRHATAPTPERPERDEGCVFCRIVASGPPSVDNGIVWRRRAQSRGAERLSRTRAGICSSCRATRRLSSMSSQPEESLDLWEATRTRRGGARRRLRPGRGQHGGQPRQGGRGRHPRPSPPARPSPVGGRHQLHDGGGGVRVHCPGVTLDRMELAERPPGVREPPDVSTRRLAGPATRCQAQLQSALALPCARPGWRAPRRSGRARPEAAPASGERTQVDRRSAGSRRSARGR